MKKHRRKVEPGLAPGTYRPTTEATWDVHVEILDFSAGELRIQDQADITTVTRPPVGLNRWIRIRGTPNATVLDHLHDAFGVHSLILEDIVSSSQRIKVEDYDNLMFTVVRTVQPGTEWEVEEHELSLILFGSTLISVFESEDERFFAPVVSRLQNPESLLRHNGADFLYHALLDLAVDCFYPVIERLEEASSAVESRILQGATDRQLHAVHRMRRATQRVRSTLWAIRDVISRIERSTHHFVLPSTIFYFRDIHDHVIHLLDAVGTLRDTANGLMELHMSSISNRMNEVMKVLTTISTVFIPITFIAGLYGMNFVHMPELGFPWAYPTVVGVMVLIAGGMIVFFKRRKWF